MRQAKPLTAEIREAFAGELSMSAVNAAGREIFGHSRAPRSV
jgi:hypothetical protein